jgi:hypothetical protein
MIFTFSIVQQFVHRQFSSLDSDLVSGGWGWVWRLPGTFSKRMVVNHHRKYSRGGDARADHITSGKLGNKNFQK